MHCSLTNSGGLGITYQSQSSGDVGGNCRTPWFIYDVQLSYLLLSLSKHQNPERSMLHHVDSSRITSILNLDTSIWIATAAGYLFMYDVRDQVLTNRKYSFGPPSLKTPNSSSGMNSPTCEYSLNYFCNNLF